MKIIDRVLLEQNLTNDIYFGKMILMDYCPNKYGFKIRNTDKCVIPCDKSCWDAEESEIEREN